MARIGFGYDIHQFSTNPDRVLRLGGIDFPGASGLEGHSDADVVLHAIADALLGASGQGDIGDHFPPDDPTWLNADSRMLLGRVQTLIDDRFVVSNVDVSIVAEKPNISTRRRELRGSVAAILEITDSQVNVKATTNEGLGALGRGEGIAAFAVVLMEDLS